MMVEMGPDRFHHALYHHMDEHARASFARSAARGRGKRYYATLDSLVGELVATPVSRPRVIVVSDHGARPMLGGVAMNELPAP